MLAAKKENVYMIKFLVGKGANRDKLDAIDNSVFHYAAMTTKDVIEVRMNWLQFLEFIRAGNVNVRVNSKTMK